MAMVRGRCGEITVVLTILLSGSGVPSGHFILQVTSAVRMKTCGL